MSVLDYKKLSLKSEWKKKQVAAQAGEYLKGCGRNDLLYFDSELELSEDFQLPFLLQGPR